MIQIRATVIILLPKILCEPARQTTYINIYKTNTDYVLAILNSTFY